MPRDADGNYDFEDLHALDLPFFNQQLQDMLAGKEVHVPTFDFSTGKRYFAPGNIIRMKPDDILIMEGIHALNPELTASIPAALKYKISTTDNRLIRRIVRDARCRGYSASDTIMRWPSVRRGEDRNVFPYQENADIMFNSALTYELYVLRRYAEPLLRRIKPTDPAHADATRLLKFLSYFEILPPSTEECIPSNSILREFIGGSIFD